MTSLSSAPAGFGTPWISLLLHSTLPNVFLTSHDLSTGIDFSQTDDATQPLSFRGYSGIYYNTGGGAGYQVDFRLDHIDPLPMDSNTGPAPEAGTAGYLFLGLALLAASRRMRARRTVSLRNRDQ